MWNEIQQYINLPYILAVVFVVQALKQYTRKATRKVATLIVAFALGVCFIAWELILGDASQIVRFSQKIMLSFPGIVAFYSYMIGPIVGFFSKKNETPAE